MTSDSLPLLAAVSAALIAGCFSIVTLINSKEQKTSEFRQAWIDSLRKEISEFTASVYFLKYYYQQGAKNDDPEFINGLKETHMKYGVSNASILLRINANETDEYLKLLNNSFLTALSDILNSVNAENYNDAAIKCNTLINAAKPLLKEEWKRVKVGEIGYQFLKYFLIALSIITAIYVGVTAYNVTSFDNKSQASISEKNIQKSEKSTYNQSLNISISKDNVEVSTSKSEVDK